MKEKNWAGNHTYQAEQLYRPETIGEVQELVARHPKVKALGSRHSFNHLADTTGVLISLERLPPVIAVDPVRRTVKLGGGVRYAELATQLHKAGYALRNLASLPHISVAGACATATHGSGDGNGCLATSVVGLELVTASGQVIGLSREQDDQTFEGTVVGLGGLGVVTGLTLDIIPTFEVWQEVYQNLSFDQLERHFEAIFASSYSVSLLTDWRERRFTQVWRKRRVEDGGTPLEPGWFGATLASTPMHPIAGHSATSATEQMGLVGPWHLRLPHFRPEHTPSSGEELQSEYLVPRPHAMEALGAIYELREALAPLLQVCEVRSIAADDLWMSPFYQQPCIGFHFTWQKNWPAVGALLPLLEKKLMPFSARPHWGKLFALPPEDLQPLYKKLGDFRKLLEQYDPQGKFGNAFLEQYILSRA